MDASGKVVMESILETKATTILEFFAGLRGTLSVTFEEGTWSVWLYNLLHPRVDKSVLCFFGRAAVKTSPSLSGKCNKPPHHLCTYPEGAEKAELCRRLNNR
jgi:hypothetical protein